MIRPDMIPPEAVEAAARAMAKYEWGDEKMWDPFIKPAEAAIAAGLAAWPGSYSLAENDSAEIRGVAAIILPLPQEVSDE